MGSWNETCWLSHLPICEDEKVVGMLLARVGEMYKLNSLAFYGEYDGYGTIVNTGKGKDFEEMLSSMDSFDKANALQLIMVKADLFDEITKVVGDMLSWYFSDEDMSDVKYADWLVDKISKLWENTTDVSRLLWEIAYTDSDVFDPAIQTPDDIPMMIKTLCFRQAITMARRDWEPQWFDGDQQNNTTIHHIIAKNVLNMVNNEEEDDYAI